MCELYEALCCCCYCEPVFAKLTRAYVGQGFSLTILEVAQMLQQMLHIHTHMQMCKVLIYGVLFRTATMNFRFARFFLFVYFALSLLRLRRKRLRH